MRIESFRWSLLRERNENIETCTYAYAGHDGLQSVPARATRLSTHKSQHTPPLSRTAYSLTIARTTHPASGWDTLARRVEETSPGHRRGGSVGGRWGVEIRWDQVERDFAKTPVMQWIVGREKMAGNVQSRRADYFFRAGEEKISKTIRGGWERVHVMIGWEIN